MYMYLARCKSAYERNHPIVEYIMIHEDFARLTVW